MRTETDSLAKLLGNTNKLLEEIEIYVDNSKTVGMLSGGSMVKVNREELLNMLEAVRECFPQEVKAAASIVNTKDSIIAEARAQADRIIKDAAEETRAMIDGDEVVAMANMRADEIIADAEDKADYMVMQAKQVAEELQNGAMTYVQSMMGGLESMYGEMIENEKAYFNSVMDKLKADHRQILENKQEIDLQIGSTYKGSRSKEDFEKKEEPAMTEQP